MVPLSGLLSFKRKNDDLKLFFFFLSFELRGTFFSSSMICGRNWQIQLRRLLGDQVFWGQPGLTPGKQVKEGDGRRIRICDLRGLSRSWYILMLSETAKKERVLVQKARIFFRPDFFLYVPQIPRGQIKYSWRQWNRSLHHLPTLSLS